MKKTLIPLLVGIIFLVIGIFITIQGNGLKERCTGEATGTVVKIIEEVDSSDDSTSYTYYPVIEYKAGEQNVSKKSDIGSNPSKYQVGEKVEILYNPNKIDEYIIKGDNTFGILGIVFIVVGAVLLVATLGKGLLVGILYFKNK